MVEKKLIKIIESNKNIIFLNKSEVFVLKNKKLLDENKIYVVPDLEKSEERNIFVYNNNIEPTFLEKFNTDQITNFFVYLVLIKKLNNKLELDEIDNFTCVDIEKDIKEFFINYKFLSDNKNELYILEEKDILNKINDIQNIEPSEIQINIEKLKYDSFLENTMYNILYLKEILLNKNLDIILKINGDIIIDENLLISISNFDLILDISLLSKEKQEKIVKYILKNDIILNVIIDDNLIDLKEYYDKNHSSI